MASFHRQGKSLGRKTPKTHKCGPIAEEFILYVLVGVMSICSEPLFLFHLQIPWKSKTSSPCFPFVHWVKMMDAGLLSVGSGPFVVQRCSWLDHLWCMANWSPMGPPASSHDSCYFLLVFGCLAVNTWLQVFLGNGYSLQLPTLFKVNIGFSVKDLNHCHFVKIWEIWEIIHQRLSSGILACLSLICMAYCILAQG